MKGERAMATHPFVGQARSVVEILVIATNNQAPGSFFPAPGIRSRKEWENQQSMLYSRCHQK